MLQGFACRLSPGLQLAPLKHTVWNPDLGQTLPLSLLPAEEPDLYCSVTCLAPDQAQVATTQTGSRKKDLPEWPTGAENKVVYPQLPHP